ncbi:hypothetical protein [Actinoplanes sp. NPDC049118]|uniref:hypothetical protein n=1 Tax=Actinoplanes sp. NPDC049118 TaxID=3155769 RepID=UPI0033E3E17A
MNHHDLDSQLRAAARPVPRGRVHQAPAQDLLERIVNTPRAAMGATPIGVGNGRRGIVRHPARWVTVGAAAIAVTIAALVVPGLGGDREAYASWSATPAQLSADDAQTIGRECVRKLEPDFGYTQADLSNARKVIAERRGEYGYLSIVTKRWSAACFRDKTGDVQYSSVFEGQVTDAQLGRAGIELQGWGQLRTSEGHVRIMSGHVGSDIAAVDVSLTNGTTVHATVDGGYFLAWYPEEAGAGAGTTVTLHKKDGSASTGLSATELYDAPKLD